VYIALSDFKLWDNRLDFTKMKTLFGISALGSTSGAGSGTFYVSRARYVRHKAGAPSLAVAIKKRGTDVAAGKIEYSSASLGGGWEAADHYVEVQYNSAHASWGAQIYTDNMNNNASPKYTGDTKTHLEEQPLGLIGASDPLVNCPMAWLVLDDKETNIPQPVEADNSATYPKGHPKYGVFFVSGWTKGEWSWLKDKNSTGWDDKDNDLTLDLTGTFGGPQYEIIADFPVSANEEYATFVSSAGLGTGWGDIEKGERIYILNPESPIYIYLAAKFQIARVIQMYETNAITLELFHY